MGKAIGQVAINRGHEIGATITSANCSTVNGAMLSQMDVAIEFSTPDSAVENIKACLNAGLPVVTGTTGWYDQLDEVRQCCTENNGTMLYASNFSMGVNILFEINRHLARLMNHRQEYNVSIEETHHIHKKDAPSGTAITLAGGICEEMDGKDHWVLTKPGMITDDERGVPVTSIRLGDAPGTHLVTYRSGNDELCLKHEAFGREGFAAGAVTAAEWIRGRQGFFTMKDLLQF